ncbi:hypothetical protein C8R44DRAFT_46743 [Mycena epipterygia]|nr:hypothetical protein C8R44DRAFT_46743 [Mycena epipterygia]
MSSASTSTVSLVSTTTVTSRAPLTGTAQPKDFQAAFARLQSTYGFSGSAPSPAPKTVTASHPTTSLASPATPPPKASKDFQAAFADLQSTYGFAGAAPSAIPKSKKEASVSFFAKFSRVASPKASSPTPASTFTPKPKTKVRHFPRPTAQMIAL